MSCLSRYDFARGCFVLKNLSPEKQVNAFEWARFTVQEAARRADDAGKARHYMEKLLEMEQR